MEEKMCKACGFIDPAVMDTTVDHLLELQSGDLNLDSLVFKMSGMADELDDFVLAECKIIFSEGEGFHPAEISFDALLHREKVLELAISLLMDAELRHFAEMLANGIFRQESN